MHAFLYSSPGVVVTPDQISEAVKNALSSNKAELDKKGWALQGQIRGVLCKEELRWANSALVKEELDRQFLELLGPKVVAQKVNR